MRCLACLLFATTSRDTVEVRAHRERAALAIWAPATSQLVRVDDVGRPAARAHGNRGPRIHFELRSAAQTEVRGVVADAPIQPLVIWVEGVLLCPGLIDVIRVAVRPRLNGPAAPAAHEPKCLSHSRSLRRRSLAITRPQGYWDEDTNYPVAALVDGDAIHQDIARIYTLRSGNSWISRRL